MPAPKLTKKLAKKSSSKFVSVLESRNLHCSQETIDCQVIRVGTHKLLKSAYSRFASRSMTPTEPKLP